MVVRGAVRQEELREDDFLRGAEDEWEVCATVDGALGEVRSVDGHGIADGRMLEFLTLYKPNPFKVFKLTTLLHPLTPFAPSLNLSNSSSGRSNCRHCSLGSLSDRWNHPITRYSIGFGRSSSTWRLMSLRVASNSMLKTGQRPGTRVWSLELLNALDLEVEPTLERRPWAMEERRDLDGGDWASPGTVMVSLEMWGLVGGDLVRSLGPSSCVSSMTSRGGCDVTRSASALPSTAG